MQFLRTQEAGTALSASHPECPKGLASSSHPSLSKLLLPQLNLRSRPRQAGEGEGSGGVRTWPPAGSSGGTWCYQPQSSSLFMGLSPSLAPGGGEAVCLLGVQKVALGVTWAGTWCQAAWL